MANAKPPSKIKYSFPPFVPNGARLIILGTLPGEESLRLQQYYAYPRNHFWGLIAALSERPLPPSFPERVALLKANRWALWDVLEGAERIGSSDAAIRNPTANAFGDFFAAHSEIKTVAFNGQKARDLFRRYVLKPGIVSQDRLTAITLPSSSPLHTIPFEEKLAVWRKELSAYLPSARQNRRAK
ncbi:DNA-deoxyinosine glycosylase [Hyphomicrobium sp.]|jgi:hypoxanthine-DNA glycosylase|uniref:DNA-deoxyinosine glycosylase n=1 Tax=Hyphomicrobium sp. TaxID=82 RepID=UPI00356A402C